MHATNLHRNHRDNGDNNVGFRLASMSHRIRHYLFSELLHGRMSLTRVVHAVASKYFSQGNECSSRRVRPSVAVGRASLLSIRIFCFSVFATFLIDSAAFAQGEVQESSFEKDPDGESNIAKSCVFESNVGPEMVIVPSGSFIMGSDTAVDSDALDDELPAHPVKIEYNFALSRCEVTVAEFSAFQQQTGYITAVEKSGGCYSIDFTSFKTIQVAGSNWREPGFEQGGNHPVTCISWDDAIAYVQWLSEQTGVEYRLPTEAEFEYVLRGGQSAIYPWGDESQCDHANAADKRLADAVSSSSARSDYVECNDRFAFTAPVGSYLPNPFGLYDLSGNVSEWVQDCWHENHENAPDDGSARVESNCVDRILRGGGWFYQKGSLRSAVRYQYRAIIADNYAGFRVARTL